MPHSSPDGDDSSSRHVDPSARIGSGTALGRQIVVGPTVVIGTESVIGDGVRICSGVQIGNGVTIDAGVVFARAQESEKASAAVVRDGVWIGAGAVIGAGLVIDAEAVIRPGTVLTRSVPRAAIVEGNPAAIVGYTQMSPSARAEPGVIDADKPIVTTPVKGVTIHTLPVIRDLRGDLTVGEFDRQIPFVPRRYFLTFGVPNREVRGEHAHRECHQFLTCARGSCAVVVDDGSRRLEIALDSANRGIHLPPLVWATQYKYSADAVLLVFASHYYDAADYVRDYREFVALVQDSSKR
jgi:UDP-2-acetamido-3-amino-2,3-dideoxy-glucuronate N-acetyltransferase